MHSITIRLLLGIVITVSQYKTQTSAECGGFRRMSTIASIITSIIQRYNEDTKTDCVRTSFDDYT